MIKVWKWGRWERGRIRILKNLNPALLWVPQIYNNDRVWYFFFFVYITTFKIKLSYPFGGNKFSRVCTSVCLSYISFALDNLSFPQVNHFKFIRKVHKKQTKFTIYLSVVMPLFTSAGSENICYLWTHSSICWHPSSSPYNLRNFIRKDKESLK